METKQWCVKKREDVEGTVERKEIKRTGEMCGRGLVPPLTLNSQTYTGLLKRRRCSVADYMLLKRYFNLKW